MQGQQYRILKRQEANRTLPVIQCVGNIKRYRVTDHAQETTILETTLSFSCEF